MDNVLFSAGGLVAYKNAAVITGGIILCAVLTAVLYKRRAGSASAVGVMLPIAYVLSVVMSRLLHWYFTGFAYKDFAEAIVNPYAGSYALPGVIIGTAAAAAIVQAMGLCGEKGLLLDCTAPGLGLLACAIRLSSHFTGTCIGNRNVTSDFLQRTFFTVAVTDTAGNINYRLRVYLIEAGLLLIAALAAYIMLYGSRGVRMHDTCPACGHTAKRFLVLFACIEMVTDSIRNDSILMRFRFFHQINPYSSFISLAQVFAMALLLIIFIYYLVRSIQAEGFGRDHVGAILSFILCAGLIGATGEFCIQRFGMVKLLLTVKTWGYISMVLGCWGMIRNIWNLYQTCIYTKPGWDNYD